MNVPFKSLIAGFAISAASITSVAVMAADTILTDSSGMTLYTFDKDSDGVSNCNGGCAIKWPPYLMEDGANAKMGFGHIIREDGSKQWTYQNEPLYTWVGDKKKGDTTGDGLGGVWHVAEKSGYSY
ncbi:hypothetical protein DN730_14430 [Marinomonas piezotolerans]|uniref:ATP-binding protein n=1 Tax=Marinomonas piezotolerans TaxID=2213058 RepID=A0A370U6W7_9GAMM|nr:hypothetical protein [Marinomonas piezotolerans]RDL43527.1 hypothetical protein DN730_14430 [Marinomonas piezotolerans]